MEIEQIKKSASEYLIRNGIKPAHKGYRPLMYAIINAARYPQLTCQELFDLAAVQISSESSKTVTGHSIYRNAHYALKASKKGSLEYTPYEFIKTCSVTLEG